ncbi:MAG TPA: polyphosphate kinase 2 family protein [Clostridia bacterium]
MKVSDYRITESKGFHFKDRDPGDSAGLSKGREVNDALTGNIARLTKRQDILFAHNRYGVLVILQAMDAAGKDGVIKHVMSGLNPQGVQVKAFKAPTADELEHDYLWRAQAHLPARGNIAIFNRSYYEDVVIVRLHNLLLAQNLPAELANGTVWDDRHRQIRDYERYLTENGIVVVKVFLHISAEEQRKRLLQRIDDPDKHWKFSAGDIHERTYWDQYQEIYENTLRETASEQAPWYIVPADRKWFARLMVSEILADTLERLPIAYPETDEKQEAVLTECRAILENEGATVQPV